MNERSVDKGQKYSSRKVWSSGCQGIYDILCGPGRQAVGWHAVTSRPVPQPTLFVPTQPLSWPINNISSSSKGQRVAQIIRKLMFPSLVSSRTQLVITFGKTMDTSRQKTVMQNWHDLLVQFKNSMTFCLSLPPPLALTYIFVPEYFGTTYFWHNLSHNFVGPKEWKV